MARKRLPYGTQIFSHLREEGRYYVDKTAFAKRLIDGKKHNFLSRPRRFGKTLFTYTLRELFEGNKKLFKGLYIYDKWDWTVTYPVLFFSLGGGFSHEPDGLQEDILWQLRSLEDENDVKAKHKSMSERLPYLVKEIAREKGQRVVILVDEYDKPITDALETEDVARTNRDCLSEFYATIKRCEEDIHFSFLTGVTRFSYTSLFSGFSNLNDITLDPEFSSICGFTDSDIDTVFAPELKELYRAKIGREKIGKWYNGYNWRGDENVYNPYDILGLFRRHERGSGWYETGSPTFLLEELKKRGPINTLGLSGMPASNEDLLSLEIGDIKAPALMFQAGYLTIAREEEGENGTRYILDYPNLEVRESLHESLINQLTDIRSGSILSFDIYKALRTADIEALETQFHIAFTDISRKFHWKNERPAHGHYANVVYSLLMGTGLPVQAETSTKPVDINIVVEAGRGIYVFETRELKRGVKKGAAMRQLRDMNYADKYRARSVPIHLIGMEFNTKTFNIENFDHETIQPARKRKKSVRKKSGQSKRARKSPARGRKKTTRKKNTRKKATRKKTTRKKSTRKKSARKKAARKKSGRAKGARKKATRKKATRKKAARKKRSPRR